MYKIFSFSSIVFLLFVSACKTPVTVIETVEEHVVEIVQDTIIEPDTFEDEPSMLPKKGIGMIQAAQTQAEVDDALIRDYIKSKNLLAKRTESGIYYTLDKTGNDEHPNLESLVKAHYKGTLLDGQVFDSSYERNEPIELRLTQVVKGWQEAIPLLGKGGKGTFIIPSDLAYGNRKVGNIPESSILIFDIELLDFE